MKRFVIDDNYLLVKNQICVDSQGREIWTENESSYKFLRDIGLIKVNKFLLNLMDSVPQDVKYLLIDDNLKDTLNSYYKKEKVLLITLKTFKDLFYKINK